MSATYHPCDRFSCPEWHQGQCFGGGCRANPIKENDNDNETEEDGE